MQRKIFFDNASTTPVSSDVYKTYIELLKTEFYNTDALYDDAMKLKKMMERSRQAIADTFNIRAEEVIFTSGASEANNLAIKGIALANPNLKHAICSKIEHSSVIHAFEQLEKYYGFSVDYLDVDQFGKVSLEQLKSKLRKDTALVSIMYVNNEVGSIQDIDVIKHYLKKNSQAVFHVDATQALGKIDLDLVNIDLMSLSAHKIEGLKGSGILIKKRHLNIVPLINGGQQEFGLRGGTSNTLVNIMFAKTLRLALENQKKYHNYIQELHDYFLQEISKISDIIINSPKDGVANIINFSYCNIPSEVMMNCLNSQQIMVSAQSTCASKSHTPSRVLVAMGKSNKVSNSCIRVSFSYHNTKEEIDYFIKTLKESIKKYG